MSRYIDADDLQASIMKMRLPSIPIDIFKSQPRADVRENIHGEWVHDGKPIHCNVCGFNPNFSLNKDNSNYCPKCGAYMRGENK